jgi:hypothetical protein
MVVSVTNQTLHRMWDLTLGSVRSFITTAHCLAEKSMDDQTLGI